MSYCLAITIAEQMGWLIAALIVLAGLGLGLKDTRRFSLARVWAISGVSFSESVRRRVLWITPLAIIGVIIVAQLQRPTDEQDAIRQTTKFCLFATGLLVTITTIILACTNLPREIENRVIYTIVTKPTTRLEIVAGKVVGFARVSFAILLIMGVFTYAYLSVRAVALRHAIDTRLEGGSVPPGLAQTLEHYRSQGLLNAKTLVKATDLQIYGKLPQPGDTRRWFNPNAEGGFIIPFDITREMVLPNEQTEGSAAQIGIIVLARIGYTPHGKVKEAALPPAPASQPGQPLPYWGPYLVPPDQRHRPVKAAARPQVGVQLLNSNRENIVVMKEATGLHSIELTNPDGLTIIRALIPAANVAELARNPQRVYVMITGASGDFDYWVPIDSAPVMMRLPDPQRGIVDVGPSDPPIFIARNSTFGQQLASGELNDAPVGVFSFNNVAIPDTADVPFELKVGIERSGAEVDSETEQATDLLVRIRDPKTGEIRSSAHITPESNHTAFFRVPAAAIAGGNFEVLVNSLTEGHYVGLAPSSLNMVMGQQSFLLNLAKSLLILWLMAILVTTVSIFCSTFLSWPIAVVLTVVILLGHWGVMQLGDATQPGIGNQIVQDLFRETNAAKAKAVSATVEKLASFLNLIAAVLPDISRFSAVEEIERGITIPAARVTDALAVALGFGLPLIVLAYVFLRNKEVAP